MTKIFQLKQLTDNALLGLREEVLQEMWRRGYKIRGGKWVKVEKKPKKQ